MWLAVERLRSEGMNKANAFKSVAKTLAAHTSRQVAAGTLKGYYHAADKALMADPVLKEQLSRTLAALNEGLKFVQERHGLGVVIPAMFNRKK